MKVHRVRLTSEEGFYEKCSLLAIGPPNDQGMCPIYKLPRRDLSKEKAEELQAKILATGQFDPANWEFAREYDASKIL